MRVLLSTIGSRGDVQPLLALAHALRDLGHEARLCVPPDFQEWVRELGFEAIPLGPELRALTASRPAVVSAPPTPEQRRAIAAGSVAIQLETLDRAVRGCDALVAATGILVAARSVAEHAGVPYAFVTYCPRVLPSDVHPPIPMPGEEPAPADADLASLWARNAARFRDTFGEALDAGRAAWGLPPIPDVRGHMFTDRPWLAADGALAPWPDPTPSSVLQTGAWLLPDARPLPDDVARFLDAGEPPIYAGFGSIRGTEGLAAAMIASARAHGRRVLLSRGWAGLAPDDDGADVLSTGDLSHPALFPRVAAVVHHGGAGTTTTAARAGVPQVVIPQMYDQPYWAERVERLGLGVAHASGAPDASSLTAALERCLEPAVRERARAFAPRIAVDGARIAAKHLVEAGTSTTG